MIHRSLVVASLAVFALGASAAARADALTFRATGPSPYLPDCNGAPQTGTLYPNAEVEPFVAANPRNPLNLVGVWQQDRWSDGGAQGLGTAYSFDGGIHWHRVFHPYTRCAGGTPANGGDYERGSDPWVSFSPNGVVHQMVLGLNFNASDSEIASAMLASRSTDGGRTWSPAVMLQGDTPERFNDKNALTADPTDSRYVYAVWDRLSIVPGEGAGPTLLARSVDNGVSWEPTRIIYDPGVNAQTIGNRIEVLPDGTLVNLFTHADFITGALTLQVIRSSDKGGTWSDPIRVADLLPIGASDPDTGTPIRDGAILAQLAISPSGTIYTVWQDGRFSGGVIDGVALSQSGDGGLSWSEPVQINRDTAVQAFTPSVHVRRDGTVGVSYYDLRSNTADPDTLPTDTWLVRSRDAVTWRESRVSSPFDLARAPFAGGLFVGDYEGLTSIGPVFVPFFAKSGGADDNRNDVYSRLALGTALPLTARALAKLDAQVAAEEAALPAFRARTATTAEPPRHLRALAWQAFERSMRARVPQWDALRAHRSQPR
ncbi:MAG TPA: sialidase family protein [Ideonella sp.]|uniref:sialidase family protein n=1 Tax=Ideonella sp. TaxID=1929293 RepID=UPI002E2ECBAF|nr:sialidase family protein [Ideonella sp.]HEX5687704.1 sialidase family protein [Ideonella sp.]